MRGRERCRRAFHYAQWLVSNNSIPPIIMAGAHRKICHCGCDERKKFKLGEKKPKRQTEMHETWAGNSKLIVKADRTLISRRGLRSPSEKGFRAIQCYLLMTLGLILNGASVRFLENLFTGSASWDKPRPRPEHKNNAWDMTKPIKAKV